MIRKSELMTLLFLISVLLSAQSAADSLVAKLSIYEDSAQSALDSAIVNIYPEETSVLLVKRLFSDDWTKRQTAVRVLAKMKDREAVYSRLSEAGVNPLYIIAACSGDTLNRPNLAFYGNSDKDDVRLSYYRYLSSLPGSSGAAELFAAFKSEKDEFMKASVLNAISVQADRMDSSVLNELAEIIKISIQEVTPRISYAVNRILAKGITGLRMNEYGRAENELLSMKHDEESFSILAASKEITGIYLLRGFAYIGDRTLNEWISSEDTVHSDIKEELKKYKTE